MGAERSYAFVAGVPGHVTVSDCHFEPGSKRNGWACSGPFTADDGSVRIDRVHIRPLLYDRPTGSIGAKVAGANRHLRVGAGPLVAAASRRRPRPFTLSAFGLRSTLRTDQDDPEAAGDAELAEVRSVRRDNDCRHEPSAHRHDHATSGR